MQHTYHLDVGRIGMRLSLQRRDPEGKELYDWEVSINSKGLFAERTADKIKLTLCDEGSFLYPDQVTEEELDLAALLSGNPVQEDKAILQMCSMLSAQWAAGQPEEAFHNTIRSSIKTWEL